MFFSNDYVILGGTNQENDYNSKISKDGKHFIESGRKKLVPSLNHAQHFLDWVGFHPGHSEVRLETEISGKRSCSPIFSNFFLAFNLFNFRAKHSSEISLKF